MKVFARVLAVLASLLLAAHFLRRAFGAGQPVLWVPVLVALGLPFLLLVRERWGTDLLRFALAAGTLVWIVAAAALYRERAAEGAPWKRGVAILAAVAGVTAVAAILLQPRDRGSERR